MARIALLTCLLLALAGAFSSPAQAAGSWLWPVRGEVLTRYRNGADPYAAGQHRGVDIAAPHGTPVVAATGGWVTFAGTVGSSGLTISLRTADGRFDTSYLHLSAAAVRGGESVERGQRLGLVGTSGRRSAAPAHLHFGVRRAGSRHDYVDPLTLLGAPRGAGGELPRALPVPAGAPAPVRPAPAPVPVSGPRGVPAPMPALVPRAAPGRAPAPAGSRLSRRGTAVGQALSPGPALGPGAARAGAGRRGGSALAPQGPPARSPRPEASPAPRPARAPVRGSGGPDLGWALACLGLAAAGLLGLRRGEGEGATVRSGSSRRGALRRLSPLPGRR